MGAVGYKPIGILYTKLKMESSFEKLMRIGESIALVHANPRIRKAEEMETPKERCLDRYFDGRAKGISQEDLESHCVQILNNPGLYCCLNQWFSEGSSKFEDPITLEEIHYGETGYFVKGENEENQIEKIPVQVAMTFPGLHRWKLESLEEHIRRLGWKDQYNGPIDFYMVITSAKRTQTDSGTGLPSVTDNQNSRGTYTFNGIIKGRTGYTIEGHFENMHQKDGEIFPTYNSKECKLIAINGNKYQGEIKLGKSSGQGTMKYAKTGSVYTGEWKNGQNNGQGTKKYPNGNVYTGEWKNGFPDGQGTYTHFDGRIFTGEFKKGKEHGQGAMKFPDGTVFTGEWENGKIQKLLSIKDN